MAPVRVLVSDPGDRVLLGHLPSDVTVDVWTGDGAPPPGDEVDLWVPGWEHSGASFAHLLAQIPGPRIIQLLTAGYDDVLPYVPDRVVLCNAGGVHDPIVAEWVLGAILAMLRRLPEYIRWQDAGEIRCVEGESLTGKTVLLLGYGSIAQAVETRLKPFGVEVLRVARGARDGVHSVAELPTLLPRCQVVVVLAPLNDTTRGMVDAAFLRALPDDALLVNAARGAILDQQALAHEVASGRLRAALDVSDPDPLPAGHPLLALPGVLYTPHVANVTSRTTANVFGFVGEQARRLAEGAAPANIVKPGGAPRP
ncbi:MAG: NAD(P)-dependent oxidoreductase [Solirubrobacterales bacterium]